MIRLWFIDALDALGGIAFASHRGPDLGQDDLDMEASTVFIGAPDFRPEPVASRATGLASTRGSFQLGFFLSGSEVGFPAPEDVAEFVRRTFLGGGGGDGDAGIGPAPPPPPDGSPSGGEGGAPESESISSMLRAFDSACGQAQMTLESAYRTELGSSSVSYWHLVPSTVSAAVAPSVGSVDDLLGYAAATLLAESLGQCPAINDYAGLALWWQALSGLGGAVHRIGLWQDLARMAVKANLAGAGNHLLANRPGLFAVDFQRWASQENLGSAEKGLIAAMWLVSDTGLNTRDRFYMIQHWLREGEIFWQRNWWGNNSPHGDPFEDLARWPIPAPVRKDLAPEAQQMTLADLLCLLSADPSAIDISGPMPSLLLFAACHLLRERGHGPSNDSPSTLQAAWRMSLVHQALRWLQGQMPRRAFPADVEAIFRSAANKRYGNRGTHHGR